MAHLMPPRTKPTDSQLRATELRETRKKKSRRIKLLGVVASVAIGVFAGPPLATWVVDAVNDPGSTSDEPTTTDPTDNSLVDQIDVLTGNDAEAGNG